MYRNGKKFRLNAIISCLLTLAMLFGIIGPANVRADENDGSVSAVFGTAVVDGIIEDAWQDVQAIVPGQTRNTATSDATVKMMWDDNALYILAEVTDAELDKTAGNPYEQDSIEIFLNEDGRRSGSYTDGDSHFRVNFDNERSVDSGNEGHWYTKTAKTETGYVVEACIMWTKEIFTPVNDAAVGFDFQVNCCAGGSRSGELSLFDTTGNAYQDTTQLGLLTFTGRGEDDVTGGFPYGLITYLEKIGQIDLTLYVNGEEVAALVAEAEALIASGTYTQEQIDYYYNALEYAVNHLDDGSGFTAPCDLPMVEELPDVLTFEDGTPVTAENWELRRDEIKKLYDYYIYGPMPDTSEENVTYEVTDMTEKTVSVTDPVTNETKDVVVNEGRLTVKIELNGVEQQFTMAFVVPTTEAPEGGYPFYSEMSGYAGQTVYYAASRGYACASWTYTDVASDDLSRTGVFYTLHPYGKTWENQTGALVAWGWGAGKILDALENGLGAEYNINPENNILAGVSRLGKATAVAAAYDSRIRVAMPTCSGAGGMASFRYVSHNKYYDFTNAGYNHDGNTGMIVTENEGLGSLQANGEIFWFNDNFAKFSSVYQLPVDQHYLAALVADPDRYLVITNGLYGEDWTNPAAMSLTYLAAREVYDLLGIRNNICINVHETNGAGSNPNHMITMMDMAYLLDYCDINLYGKDPADVTTDQNHLKRSPFFEDVNWDSDWDKYIDNVVTGVDAYKWVERYTSVANGSPVSKIAELLPSTAYVYVDEARARSFPVTWNVKGWDYNPACADAQEFTVSGTVAIPEDLSISEEIDTTVYALVKVGAREETLGFGTFENLANANTYSAANVISGNGENAAEAEVAFMWNNDGIAFTADVTDADIYSADASAEQDSITVSFAAGDNARSIIIASDGSVYEKSYSADFSWSTFQASLLVALNPVTDVTVNTELTENGWTVKGIIPWETLGITEKNGSKVALEAVLNDYSEGALVCQKAVFAEKWPGNKATASYMGFFNVDYDPGFLAKDLHSFLIPEDARYAVIVAEGQIEDSWNNAGVLKADKLLSGEEGEDGPADIRLMWDDAYLYIYADVNDDSVVNVKGASEKEDSIYVAVAADNNDGTDTVTFNVTADGDVYTDAYVGEFSWVTWGVAITRKLAAFDGAYVSKVAKDNGWALEICITWDKLGITPGNGNAFAFDAIVTDVDEGNKISKKAVFIDCYPENKKTVTASVWGMNASAEVDAGLLAYNLTSVVMTSKDTDFVSTDIGRYDFLTYLDGYYAAKVDIYPVKDSFDEEYFNKAKAYAVNPEATAEGIAAYMTGLEEMAAKIYEDNYGGKLMSKYGTPLVDGSGDDAVWANAYTYKTTNDGNGQYADIKSLWDEKAAYFLVEVHDPTYDVSGSDAHQKDSVEFFMIPESDAANNSFGRDGGQWRINRANIITVTFGDNEPFYAKLRETEYGYVVEARYAFAESMNIEAFSVLNTDIAVNLCANGSRTTAVAWASGDCYSNPNTSGQIIFLDKTAGESSAAAGYDPYQLLKVLDRGLEMKAEDYDADDFAANYDKAKLQRYYDAAVSGNLDAETINAYYADVIDMMSKITYDGVHKSVLGFEAISDYPDAFKLNDGRTVASDADWELRHDEIQDLYEFYMYGKLPKAEETGLVKNFSYDEGSDKYIITVSRPGIEEKSFSFKVYLPEGEAPVGGWPYIINYGGNISGAQAAGYAVIDYSSYGDVASNDSYYNGVFYAMYPECRGDEYVTGVGPLAARAWGAGLIIDTIEAGIGSLNALNPKNSVVTGFSFLGKTALVTGVLEDRIAVTNPQHSGVGGAAPFRFSAQGKFYTTEEYGFKEDHLCAKIEPIGQVQGQGMAWVKTIFADFLGGDSTPFDTYMLLSLVAPRGLFVTGGYYDDGTNPEGMYAAYVQAKQVYKFLGAEGNIAFGDYATSHESSTAETNDVFAFCDYIFYGKELYEGFYDTVFDNSPDRASYDVIVAPEKEESNEFSIVSQPADCITAKSHDTFTFTVEAKGKDVSYMWYYSNPGDTDVNGNRIFHKSGNATAVYTRTASAKTDGIQVYCVVKSGDRKLVSNIATGTIGKATLEIIAQPQNVSGSKHASAVFSVGVYATKYENGILVENTDLTYNWYIKLEGEDKFRKGSKKVNYTRTISATTDGMQVYCVVTDEFGNKAVSGTVTLSMTEAE